MAKSNTTNVLWISFAPINIIDGVLASNLASARYRIIAPANYLASTNKYRQNFISTHKNYDAKELTKHVLHNDVVIFSKSFDRKNECIAKIAAQNGVKVIFDICDNHFETPQLTNHYIEMSKIAHLIIASTPDMAAVIKEKAKRRPLIITDPYDSEYGKPNFKPNPEGLKLCWFGSPSNIDSLKSFMPELVNLSRSTKINLHVVTTPKIGVEQTCDAVNAVNSGLQMNFSPWSIKTTQQAVYAADIIIIPSLKNEHKQVKSPNRIVDALWSGRYVVAHPIPAYKKFSKWAFVKSNLCSGILWALNNKKRVEKRISNAQRYIERNHSPIVIGKAWEKAIDST